MSFILKICLENTDPYAYLELERTGVGIFYVVWDEAPEEYKEDYWRQPGVESYAELKKNIYDSTTISIPIRGSLEFIDHDILSARHEKLLMRIIKHLLARNDKGEAVDMTLEIVAYGFCRITDRTEPAEYVDPVDPFLHFN